MVQHGAGCDAFLRVEDERLHEEVDTVRSHTAETHLIPVLATNWVLSRNSVPRELCDAGPVILGRCADGFADETDLVKVRVARKVGRTHDKLRKDGADGPDVNSAAVVLCVKEQLRGTIPAGDDARRHELVRIGKATRETKISKLNLAVSGDEQVVWLDITVQDKVLVAEPHGAGEHAHPGLDVSRAVADVFRVADEHLKVAAGEVLED